MSLSAIQSRQFGNVLTTDWDNSDLKGTHKDLRDFIEYLFSEQITKPVLLKHAVFQRMLACKVSALDEDTVKKIQNIVTVAFNSAMAVVEYRFEATGKAEWFLTMESARKELSDKDKGEFKEIVSKVSDASLKEPLGKKLELTFVNHSTLKLGTLVQTLCNEIDYLYKIGAIKKEALIEAIKLFNKAIEKDLPKETKTIAAPSRTPQLEKEMFCQNFIEKLVSKAHPELCKNILSNLGMPHLQRKQDSTPYDKILMMFEANLKMSLPLEKIVPIILDVLSTYKTQDIPNPHARDVAVQQAVAVIKELFPVDKIPANLEAVVEKVPEPKPPVDNMISAPVLQDKEAFKQLKGAIENDFIKCMIESAPKNMQEDICKRLQNPMHEGRGKTTNEVVERFKLALETASNFNELKTIFNEQMDEYCYQDIDNCKIRTPASDAGVAILKRISQSYLV